MSPRIANPAIKLGRTAGEVAAAIRQIINSGTVPTGGFLPPERTLAEEYKVDKKTVRRAFQSLAGEGLVEIVGRHGYRNLVESKAADTCTTLAYIPPFERNLSSLALPASLLLPALHAAANRRGFSILGVGSQRPPQAILAELERVGVCGIILDTDQAEIVAAIRNSGIPAVAVDAWLSDAVEDCILQDGHEGARLAVQHLLAAGCKRIAWLGPESVRQHAADRFGGFSATLNSAGTLLTPELNLKVSESNARTALRELLTGPNPPDGVCALWMSLARDAALAIHDAHLVLGRDIHLVGWCPEEAYSNHYRVLFSDAPPPTVTWSATIAAETAIARLLERAHTPELPPLRIHIPVKLRLA